MTTTYFRTEYADEVGRAAALMYERICLWYRSAKVKDADGNLWVYRTLKQWAKELGCSVTTVQRAKARLIREGWIETARLQAKKWKQVLHYRPIRDERRSPEADSGDDGEHKYRTTRENQSTQLDSTETNTSSISKKKDRIKELKKQLAAAKKAVTRKTRGFTPRESSPKGICKACEGSGRLVDDATNTVYGCLCVDSKKFLKPAPEWLYQQQLLQEYR